MLGSRYAQCVLVPVADPVCAVLLRVRIASSQVAIMVLTTSSLFLHTLVQVGIDHVFVNWGSDHPAMLEELERQRATNGAHALTVVTSPNEMVALSAAHGYAQVTGKPAAVIVHVDVGTQVRLSCTMSVSRDTYNGGVVVRFWCP